MRRRLSIALAARLRRAGNSRRARSTRRSRSFLERAANGAAVEGGRCTDTSLGSIPIVGGRPKTGECLEELEALLVVLGDRRCLVRRFVLDGSEHAREVSFDGPPTDQQDRSEHREQRGGALDVEQDLRSEGGVRQAVGRLLGRDARTLITPATRIAATTMMPLTT